MIKINRTTEYGLMALRHMSRKRQSEPYEVTSAREVSDTYGLPFEITAKTLQRLKDTGLIQSAQGAKGGYTLARELDRITLAEFLELMEGPQSVVACSTDAPSSGRVSPGLTSAPCQCQISPKCEIRQVMGDLNGRVYRFLSGIRLNELAMEAPVSPALVVGEEP